MLMCHQESREKLLNMHLLMIPKLLCEVLYEEVSQIFVKTNNDVDGYMEKEIHVKRHGRINGKE